jgi:iron complex outermembrane receptor protein
VTDKAVPFTGVNISVKGTSLGTLSDTSGKFSLSVPSSATTLVFSFVGFATQEVAIPQSGDVNIQMEEVVSQLDEVVITVGSRVTQRTITDTPLPVDVLSSKDLSSTGHTAQIEEVMKSSGFPKGNDPSDNSQIKIIFTNNPSA